MRVTERFLLDNTTPRGQWNAKQLAVLGIQWPPIKGWKQRVIGMEISEEEARRFSELRIKRSPCAEQHTPLVGQQTLFGDY